MAETPRVYPVDVESGQQSQPASKSNAPLMPPGTTYSDRRSPPPPPPTPKRRRGCFCRCICWTVSLFLILIILIGITVGALYLVYRPKIPDYSVDKLSVDTFIIDSNTIDAYFDVTISTYNPNKRIGIYYVDGSDLSVWYTDTKLCEGELPVFYQGHRNKTVLDVVMSGKTQVRDGLMEELNTVRNSGSVPLTVKGTVPVKVKFGGLKLWKMKFKVRCDLVVDSLSSENDTTIKSNSCSFKFKHRLFGIAF